jgi:hypothetical protein
MKWRNPVLSDDPTPTLAQIVAGLAEVYNDEGACIWLMADQVWPHPVGGTFHSSALAMIREGRSVEVMERVNALASGAM